MKALSILYVVLGASILAVSQSDAADVAPFRLPSEVARPLSVFDNKASNARDPFFPKSTRSPYAQQPKADSKEPGPKALDVKLSLKGILGQSGTRLALINNQTFAEGESGSVKVPGGYVRIRCLKINDRSAVISIEGKSEQTELRLQDK